MLKFIPLLGTLLANPRSLSLTTKLHYKLTKKNRVRQLREAKIQLQLDQGVNTEEVQSIQYDKVRSQLKDVEWQTMDFDKLCNLEPQLLRTIEMQTKKDKFNVDDRQFYDFAKTQLKIKLQNSDKNLQKLNSYYKKCFFLLYNLHQNYNQVSKPYESKTYYLHEMYIIDLDKDKRLANMIAFFVNNIAHPSQLEDVAEPSLIKTLLTLKRELIMQGMLFESKKQIKKQIRQKKKIAKKADEDIYKAQQSQQDQQLDIQPEYQEFTEDQLLQELDVEFEKNNQFQISSQQVQKYSNKVKVVRVLGYEYEFWVDVKHNRNKNGVQEDYVIEEREIQNPNSTILLKERFPRIKVKYIVHKRKRKEYAMNFCVKAILQIKINNEYLRRVKIEWDGPSSKQADSHAGTYKVIDYENIMNGNPTIRPVFTF